MPTRLGRDSKGCYAQWGQSGAKYYYECGNAAARERARGKANRQGAAIRAGGYVGKGDNMNKPNYSQMLKRKAGLSDQRGSGFTSEAEGHVHQFHVVMDEDGNVAQDFDAVPGFEYGYTDWYGVGAGHYHLLNGDGTTGPANEEPGGHTHNYEMPMSGTEIISKEESDSLYSKILKRHHDKDKKKRRRRNRNNRPY